jgi:hypothetical protein
MDMPHWLRIIRGVIGTGVTFAAGVGVLATVIGGIAWFMGGITGRELTQIVGRSSVVAGLLGVLFAGILAITARARRFNKLSLPTVGGLGAGAGVLYFLVLLAGNGGKSWARGVGIANFVALAVMGAGSAIAMVTIARRARSALDSGDGLRGLGAGDEEIVPSRRDSKVKMAKP